MAADRRALIFAPEAEEELLEAAAWYEQERPGLGREFLNAVDDTTRVVTRMPGVGAHVEQIPEREDVRKLRVTGFPFAIVYRESEAGVYVWP